MIRATQYAAAVFLFAFATAAQASDSIYTGLFNNRAVSGYDTVAYFTEGRPVKGDSAFQTEYKGATWRFSSAENLALFETDPARYAPQYGGYCAWAVSQGHTASGNPNNWAIVEDKLYLNYDDNVQKTWNTDREGFIELADSNWPTVLD